VGLLLTRKNNEIVGVFAGFAGDYGGFMRKITRA
jgi:hypothetical protein